MKPLPRTLEAAVLSTLMVMLYAALIPRHEPWFDEAQAWLLARDSSLGDLIVNRLRYEGHPCLWYLLLRIPVGLGLPYASLNYLSAALSVAGAAIFWVYSPLPRLFRLLFPFTFFLFFQFGVVARSYSLLPLFTFLFCTLFPERFKKPILFTALLTAIAQISVHSAIVAGCWWLLYLKESSFPWKTFWKDRRSPQVQAAMLFVAGGLFLIFQLTPPKDILRPDFFDKDSATFFRMVYTLWNGPLVEWWPLSLAVFGTSLFWFHLRGVLAWYLFPGVTLWLFFGALYGKAWHEGVVFCLWLAALWLSFLPSTKSVTAEKETYGRILIHAAMGVILGFHLSWSLSSSRYDFANPYSGARELAAHLKETKLDKESIMATQFFSPAVLPYFEDNIFLNFNKGKRPSFFWWSLQYSFNDSVEFILKNQPKAVVVAMKFPDSSPIPTLPGYRWTKSFTGDLYFKDRRIEPETFLLFTKEP